MTKLFASAALLPNGWQRDVTVEIAAGKVAHIATGASSSGADERHAILIPAMANLHSHAFQRAMAGLAEMRGPGADSFWSWRNVMYKFALAVTPDDVEAIAAQLYMEMLEAGFGRVGEFHYLHHDQDGRPYADIAEMAGRIASASAEAGIGLTLLPVFYAHSGFGPKPPSEGQRRFINSLDSFAALMEGCERLVSALPGANLGLAPHSLRAATLDEIHQLLPLAKGGPVHIHVAEQTLEVEDCLAATGQRPVEVLLDGAPVDQRWCLIHATHLTPAEITGIAATGAVAGLCPITEANLGDGIFAAPPFLAAGGRFGIGSDSNILISVAEELRQLEYSQRLGLRARNVVAAAGQSTGQCLFEHALTGGATALATDAGIATGHAADLVSLDVSSVDYLPLEATLDAWIFGSGVHIGDVWSQGQKQVVNGRHLRRDAISNRFAKTMRRLVSS